jgi:hypothetical protein
MTTKTSMIRLMNSQNDIGVFYGDKVVVRTYWWEGAPRERAEVRVQLALAVIEAWTKYPIIFNAMNSITPKLGWKSRLRILFTGRL